MSQEHHEIAKLILGISESLRGNVRLAEFIDDTIFRHWMEHAYGEAKNYLPN